MNTILHVDSDPSARALVVRAVEGIRPRVDLIAVETLRTGLSLLSATSVACVVTETDLPDAAGAPVVQRLSLARPGMPIVVLAAAGPSCALNARSAGVVGHMRKDDAAEGRLALLVREALGRAVLAQAVLAGTVADGPEVTRFGGADFIAGTTAMRAVMRLVECAAES